MANIPTMSYAKSNQDPTPGSPTPGSPTLESSSGSLYDTYTKVHRLLGNSVLLFTRASGWQCGGLAVNTRPEPADDWIILPGASMAWHKPKGTESGGFFQRKLEEFQQDFLSF